MLGQGLRLGKLRDGAAEDVHSVAHTCSRLFIRRCARHHTLDRQRRRQISHQVGRYKLLSPLATKRASLLSDPLPPAVDPRLSESGFVSREVVTLNSSCFAYHQPLLSLDGGGLRGIITVEILIEVEKVLKQTLVERKGKRITLQDIDKYKSGNEFEVDLADYFKAIAGVSTGSWIATYLASKGGHGASRKAFDDKIVVKQFGNVRPGSVEGLRVFFLHYAQRLYPAWTIRFSLIPRPFRFPRFRYAGWNCPQYSIRGLEATLDLFLGQSFFSQTGNTTLMIHTYDLERKATVLYMSDHYAKMHDDKAEKVKTYIFKNEEEPRIPEKPQITSELFQGKDFYMKDIARASSAAPTIYEAKRFTAVNDESFGAYAIDGSLMSNNPTLMASYFLQDEKHINHDHSLSIISIGTGIATGRYREHSKAGAYQWFIQTSDFLAIMMDGGAEFVQTQFYTLYYMDMEENDPGYRTAPMYLRIQTVYDQRTKEGEALAEMYEANNVKALKDVGEKTVERYKEAINTHVQAYVLPNECMPPPDVLHKALIEKKGAKSSPPPAS